MNEQLSNLERIMRLKADEKVCQQVDIAMCSLRELLGTLNLSRGVCKVRFPATGGNAIIADITLGEAVAAIRAGLVAELVPYQLAQDIQELLRDK